MKDTVLVVDDAAVIRAMLAHILSSKYTVIQAANGQEALNVLAASSNPVAAIILDLVMPVMDGFSFLEAISTQPEQRDIPIIVSTGDGGAGKELRALELGAWDFVAKPFDPNVLKARLDGVIRRSRLSALERMRYFAEYDSLTGIYNKAGFFTATRKMLNENKGAQFVFLRFDIDRFHLFNAFNGDDEGDRFLRYIADNLKSYLSSFGTCSYGRIESDIFACCAPYTSKALVHEAVARVIGIAKSFNRNFDIVPTVGAYYIDDVDIPVMTMLDRATLAAKTLKGQHTDAFAEYTSDLSTRLEREQRVLNETTRAFTERQFIMHYQPKYDLALETPHGSEALVRWKHPERGLVSPGEFIPLFEQNGLITRLDRYVWDSVCRQMRTWLDEGINLSPISVNVSRVSLRNPLFPSEIKALVDSYNIPPRLLELEFTETAYMDDPEAMRRIVSELRGLGFRILMDDFGSGYSSMNALKDLEIDVLKIDMGFLSESETKGRGESILAAVVRIAKWLGIPAIAEGVETKRQAAFLKSIGCEYAQGFYFSRPLPPEDYAALAEETQSSIDADEQANVLALLWSDSPAITSLFADNARPACLFELTPDHTDIIRVNEPFATLFGTRRQDFKGQFLDILPEDTRETTRKVMEQTAQKRSHTLYQGVALNNRGEATISTTLRLTCIGRMGSTWVFMCGVYRKDENPS